MKLRQTASPADKASWTEHFYTGSVKVKNGVAETDNKVWVELLRQRGFSIVSDDASVEDTTAEERKQDLEETGNILDGAAVTDEVPEQEIVPEGAVTVADDVDVKEVFPEEEKEVEKPKGRAKKTADKENEHVNL